MSEAVFVDDVGVRRRRWRTVEEIKDKTEEQQKESQLYLVEALLQRLGAYYVFSEVIRIMVCDKFVDESIALQEPALRVHASSIMKGLAASLPEAKRIDSDLILRDALAKWSRQGKPQ